MSIEIIREIAFDTETTGLEWDKDDRIIELGAVELENLIPTGRTFQCYVNPGRPVSEDTIRITGITDDDLRDQPGFEHPSIVEAFLEFIGDAHIVAHNASFDRGFLNMELKRCGRKPIPDDRWTDTAAMARQKFPGSPVSLDALCKRFDISLESRSFHGALLDSQLLATVYLELSGGRLRAFNFDEEDSEIEETVVQQTIAKQRPSPLESRLTKAERESHQKFVDDIGASALWHQFDMN